MRWLILVPTQLEREKLELPTASDVLIEVCGFGLVAAAANASRLIAQYQPRKVLLCGIAGALNQEAEIGSAYQFKRAALYGVGIGHGADHLSAEQLGWQQWQDGNLTIGNELPLEISPELHQPATRDLIVSCCAASAGSADADIVRQKFPAGSVEEMEGFAVAMSAKIASIPCCIVRGVSNIAGDREHGNWNIDGAMQSVSLLVTSLIGANQ